MVMAIFYRCSLWLQGQLSVDNVAALWERAVNSNARSLEAACTAFMVSSCKYHRDLSHLI